MASKSCFKNDIFTYVLVTVLSAMIGFFIIKFVFLDNTSLFVSNLDGKNYAVRKVGNNETKQTAANYLAILTSKINKLVHYMYIHNLPDPDTAKRLFFRWSKCELKETNSHETSAAYTLNKSTEIRLCIRNHSGQFEDINTSMFVVLHELAHVMSISYGHGDEFKNNFSYITSLASNLSVYKPEDFHRNPKTYCGVAINTSPCSNEGSCEYGTIPLK